ncbi:MAG: phosphate ABC transporter substrate-binding protein [Desulfovibrio sp.]|nr:phosphate ABC transporter substrate-binding protein [Desulfovibrio sp.]
MKRTLFITLTAFCFAAAIFSAPAAAAAPAEEIIITGSTTVLPVMQKAGEAFMAANPDISLSISGGGSGNGIKALNEGLCRVAMSSRDIKESERKEGADKGVKAVRTAVAVDALVPVVHPDNPVQNLSVEQLRGIYAGRITKWNEVGGKDENIVMISRDSSSGTFETWQELIMAPDKTAPSALSQASNGAVVQAVAGNRRAVGYIGFGYLNSSIKKINVNGIEATAESALSRKWPIARELYIFTDGAPAGAVKKLTDYLLDPQKGQKAVAETGYIPLSGK